MGTTDCLRWGLPTSQCWDQNSNLQVLFSPVEDVREDVRNMKWLRKFYSWLESSMLNESLSKRKFSVGPNRSTLPWRGFWRLFLMVREPLALGCSLRIRQPHCNSLVNCLLISKLLTGMTNRQKLHYYDFLFVLPNFLECWHPLLVCASSAALTWWDDVKYFLILKVKARCAKPAVLDELSAHAPHSDQRKSLWQSLL